MKQFLSQHRNSVWAKALYSSAAISLFLYLIIRGLTYDFPMSWAEECSLFIKVTFTGTFMMSLAAMVCTGIDRTFERIKRRKNAA